MKLRALHLNVCIFGGQTRYFYITTILMTNDLGNLHLAFNWSVAVCHCNCARKKGQSVDDD